MQRDTGRVRCDSWGALAALSVVPHSSSLKLHALAFCSAQDFKMERRHYAESTLTWGRLFREPKLFACAVVSLTFHAPLQASETEAQKLRTADTSQRWHSMDSVFGAADLVGTCGTPLPRRRACCCVAQTSEMLLILAFSFASPQKTCRQSLLRMRISELRWFSSDGPRAREYSAATQRLTDCGSLQKHWQEGGAPEMQGTWLGLPLAMIHRPLEDLSNSPWLSCPILLASWTIDSQKPLFKLI